MKNIFKFLFMISFLPILLLSCRDDDGEKGWQKAEPTFKLYDTSLGSIVMYPTMENNPLSFTWEVPSNATGSYSIVISKNVNFDDPVVELGTSDKNSFGTTVGDFNKALLNAGYNPYDSQLVYLRIINGTQISNTISFSVTPYPVSIPVITYPTNGSTIPLDINNSSEIKKITWTDTDYGVDVKYTIDIAKKGSAFINLGTVNNKKYLELTSKDLVFALLKTGAPVNVESEFDIKVIVETKSTGGTIIKSSDVVTFKAKPYEVTSYLYAPGAYQGWSPETAESLISPKSDGIYTGYIKYLEPNSEFKITPARNWDNSYGTDDNVHIIYNGGGNLKAANSGYQKLTVDTNALTFSLEAYSWGLVGSATPGGWDNDTDMVWNSANQTWEIANVELSAGDIKFRLNDGWDVNYGDNGADGSLESGGANIAITTAGNYKIVLDLVNMVYTVTKL